MYSIWVFSSFFHPYLSVLMLHLGGFVRFCPSLCTSTSKKFSLLNCRESLKAFLAKKSLQYKLTILGSLAIDGGEVEVISQMDHSLVLWSLLRDVGISWPCSSVYSPQQFYASCVNNTFLYWCQTGPLDLLQHLFNTKCSNLIVLLYLAEEHAL